MTWRLLAFALMFQLASGFAALLSPLAGAADLPEKTVHMGFVFPGEAAANPGMKQEVFWARLRTLGWEEGRNLKVERRYTRDDMEAFPGFMAEMVQQNVDIIMTTTTRGALAAKKATDKIPIVVHYMNDPVAAGLVSSFAHPGGNLTGMTTQFGEGIAAKSLELLQDAIPKLSNVAILSNANNPGIRRVEDLVANAARARSIKSTVLRLQAASEIDRSVQRARQLAQAVIVLADPLFIEHHDRVVTEVNRVSLPAIYGYRLFVVAGGLMSYGPNPAEAWGQSAVYIDKILRGANAGELPIVQPTQFLFAVNLKTAKALGLTFPESILLRADEVIR